MALLQFTKTQTWGYWSVHAGCHILGNKMISLSFKYPTFAFPWNITNSYIFAEKSICQDCTAVWTSPATPWASCANWRHTPTIQDKCWLWCRCPLHHNATLPSTTNFPERMREPNDKDAHMHCSQAARVVRPQRVLCWSDAKTSKATLTVTTSLSWQLLYSPM